MKFFLLKVKLLVETILNSEFLFNVTQYRN